MFSYPSICLLVLFYFCSLHNGIDGRYYEQQNQRDTIWVNGKTVDRVAPSNYNNNNNNNNNNYDNVNGARTSSGSGGGGGGYGISAWGLISLILFGILLLMFIYYALLCYPIIFGKEANYDSMERDSHTTGTPTRSDDKLEYSSRSTTPSKSNDEKEGIE